MLDSNRWLQNTKRDNEVRGENEILLPVNTETVGVELFAEDVEETGNIFGELMNDVKIGVGLDETSWGGSDG